MNPLILFFLVAVITTRAAESLEEPCFTFKGNSYLRFSLTGYFDNMDKVHYEMKFRTGSPHGLLMFAKGAQDLEALYIRDGILHYHLFNTARSGVQRQFGGHYATQERVDTNTLITLHVYRSYPVADEYNRSQNKTGIEIDINGIRSSHVDHLDREGIDILSDIYFGGYPEPMSSTVGNFTGEIKGLKEEKNSYVFENPTLNYASLVDLHCDDFP